jgi:hypothetical protein
MATTSSSEDSMQALEPLVGDWKMTAVFKGLPPADAGAHMRIEWMPGKQFLIQRWEVPVPEAPNGIALIGIDPAHEGGYLQHYFDERGVARVYRMSFTDRVWKLWREEPDFTPLDFSQRYTGNLSEDGKTITGAWEMRLPGNPWQHDFDLTYARI